MASGVGFVAVPVVPTFKGMSKEFSERLEKPARESGKRAGKAMTEGVESAVENLERQVRASSSKLKDLDRDYEVAYSKQMEMKEKAEAATVKLQAAEEKYQEAVAKGGSGTAEYGRVLDAKSAVTRANRNLEQAEIDVRVAEEKHRDQLNDLNSTLGRLQDAQADLNREMDRSAGSFQGVRGHMQAMADQAKNSVSQFAEFSQKYKFHATAALGGIGLIAKESMAYASEAEQSYGAVESIFGEHAQGIIDKSKQAATEVGVSGREYRELSANMGAMLKNMGTPMDEVAGKSENLVGVAADLAATFGGTTKDAVEAVTSLLRGETDPIERYGVSIKQADIQARMAADGLDGLTGEAEKQAKAQTLLKLLTEQTADAQGQFARETDTAAHKQQVATAKYNDAKEAIGTALLPIMAELADGAANVAQILGEHPAIFIAVAGAIGTVAAAMVTAATLAPIFQWIGGTAAFAAGGMSGFAAAAWAAIAPVAAVVAAVAAVGVALWAFFTKTEVGRDLWDKLVGALKTGWDWISGVFAAGWDWLADKIGAFFNWFRDAWGGMWDLFTGYDYASMFQDAFGWDGLVDRVTSVKDTVVAAWSEMFTAFKGGDDGYGGLAQIIGADQAEWVVNKLADVGDALSKLPDLARGVWDVLFNGEYTGMPFGLNEDSGVVQFLFDVRQAVQDLWDYLQEKRDQLVDLLRPAVEFMSGMVRDVVSSLGDVLKSLWDSLKSVGSALGSALGSVAVSLFQAMVSVLKSLWEMFKSLWDAVRPIGEFFVKLLLPILKVVGAVIGGALVAAIFVFIGALKVVAEVLAWVADKFAWLMEHVLGPLIEILGKVAAFIIDVVVTAFTWLAEKVIGVFTTVLEWIGNFLTFLQGNFWPALSAVLGFVGDAFTLLWDGLTWAWENVIQPVFNGIWQLAQVTLAVIGTAVLAPLLIAWNLLSAAIQWAWENVIQPVWQAIVSFAQEVLWPALQGVIQWIGDAWQWLADKFSEGWGWMRDTVLAPMADFFQNTLWPAIQAVLGFINDAWQLMANAMGVVWTWLWDNIFAPFIDGLSNVASWFKARVDDMVAAWQWFQDLMHAGWQFVNDYVFAPLRAGLQIVADWFRARVDDMLAIWQGFQDLLHAGWRFIEEYVFNAIGKGLDSVQSWFRKGVDGIGRIWDGLRAVAARPVKFVIDTVWNNGILKAWNAIADFLPGIDTVNKIDLGQLGGYAQGGVLPGYTPGRDVHDFYSPTGGMIHLSGGEAIMRPEWTRAVGGKKTVDRLNAMAKAGKLDEDMMAIGLSHGTLGAFANGGVIGAMANIVRAKYPMLQLTSGYRPGDGGMHGAGLASDWSNGHGNTPQQLALAHDIARTYPGSAELIYDSPGWAGNIKNGRNVGPFGAFYTMAQAGPHHHHVHWAMTTAPTLQFGGGVFEGGSNGGPGGPGGGFFNWIADKAKGIWSDMVDPLKRRIEDMREDSKFWDIPFGFLETIKDKTWSFLSSKFGSGGGVGSGSVDISDVSGAVAKQVETVFARHGFTGADWEAAKWIIGKESGWSPTATNPSSGAYGLFQFNPMGGNTLAAYLPDRNPDPAVQADAGARYIKDRYGSPTAAKAFWERNGWYSSGGVFELPKLYDQGGWLEHGKAAFNLSGKPEPVFNAEQWRTLAAMIRSGASMGDVARELGRLVPALQDQANAFAKFADNAEEWLRRASDYNSIEGINARQGIRRVLDLGLELPGTDAVKSILDAEKTLWDTRANAVSNLDAITEKEKALQEAHRAVSELEEGPEGVSKKDQKKIDKAQKALDEAKKEQSKADSDKKRAKAAEKVAKAEEKLKEVREEVDDRTEESAKKHAEELVKANDAVTKAEKELAEARHKQAMDLDNVVLASQGQIQGLIPQAQQLASQLIGMGAPAQAVNAGLGGVVSVLGKVAGFAGPAGITLGMVLGVAKSVINVVKTLVKAIVALVNKIRQARLEALKTLAEGWAVIAEYAKLVTEMQGKVTSLQQALIRGANAQREAEYNLKLAQHDRYIAEAEGALKVAEARLALDAEIKRGATIAQLKLMGLHEDWDTYMAYQALEAQGVLEEWSDSAISALYTYEKARAEALKGEVTARLEQIKAEAALAEAQRQNVRNQQDLLRAQERLIRMSAKVAGVDLVEATGTAQVAKLMAEMAEVQQAMDKNVLGRWGVGLGANGSYANEYRGQQAQYESLKKALDAVLAETGVKIDQDRLDRTLKLMGRAAFREGDAMAVLRSQLPELAQAETALRVNEALKPVYEARDQRDDMERKVEDLAAEIDLYDKTTPLEHTLKGLDYTIRSLDQAAQAWAEGNEELRGEYLRASRTNNDAAAAAGVDWKLDPKYANAKLRERVEREVVIHMSGEEFYTANEVDQLLDQALAGTDTRHRVVWTSSQVAASRRKERV